MTSEIKIPEWQQVGAQFPVGMSWRLPDDVMMWGNYTVEVVAVEDYAARLLVVITGILSLRTSVPPEQVDKDLISRAKELVGKYARYPYVAAKGTQVPMRLATLTGEYPYFFDEDPRSLE